MDTPVHMYGVAVVKNKEICGSVDFCFNTEKVLLTSKNKVICVIFRMKPTIMAELYERKTFVKNKDKKSKTQFCHFPVWYLDSVCDAQ